MNETGQPFVSVLTPVYNGGAYLAECIESVLAQTYHNFEYIIVNNCSKDNTLEIANRYASKDSRIKVVTNETFVEVIDNHNNAFNLMSPDAKYCKVVSGDDYIFPSCLAKMVELAEANPSVGIIGSFQLSGTVVRWIGFRYPQRVMSGREVCRRILLIRQEPIEGSLSNYGHGTPTSLMYRADLVRSTRTFYPNASPHSDTSACFEALQKSDFGFVYEILSYERTHEATQTSASQKINRFLSAELDVVLKYGPIYLKPDELKEKIKTKLQVYYRFLAIHWFFHAGSKTFWEYHENRLKELGFPLKKITLVKAAVLCFFQEILNPSIGIAKLRKRLCI